MRGGDHNGAASLVFVIRKVTDGGKSFAEVDSVDAAVIEAGDDGLRIGGTREADVAPDGARINVAASEPGGISAAKSIINIFVELLVDNATDVVASED